MTRLVLWGLAGILLGLAIHIVVMLTLPSLATRDLWARLSDRADAGALTLIEPVAPGAPNPLQLDPELAYAFCRIDLSERPMQVVGTMPDAFWSIAVYDRNGVAIYSTTNRDGIGTRLNLGLFDPSQVGLIASQEIAIDEDMLIVETPVDDLFVVIRLAPPHPVMAERYRAALSGVDCHDF